MGPIDIFADYEFGVGMIEDKLHSKPLVSVIVLDFNGQHFWGELLEALSIQTFRDFELIVVENGVQLELPESLGEIPIRRLHGQGNVGFAAGANLGVSKSRGNYLALLNNDTVPNPNWLEELVASMQRNPIAGAVCSKALFYDRYVELRVEVPVFSPTLLGESEDPRELGVMIKLPESTVSRFSLNGTHGKELREGENWVWTKKRARLLFAVSDQGSLVLSIASHVSQKGTIARFRLDGGEWQDIELLGEDQSVVLEVPPEAGFDVINSAGSSFDRDWALVEEGLYERDGLKFSESRELEMGSACSMLLRRSALEGEPFDSEFFAYYEDSDLCYRLRRSQWRVLLEPRSVVRHHGSATSGVMSPFLVFQALRNRIWMAAKHAPSRIVLRVLFRDLFDLDKYEHFLDEDTYSLSRLKREAGGGFIKRLWRRFCDSD